ncbi:hypothetical protein [Fodinibius sp. Rm-B-1B1-1]|uniref:hypothetical protein n=1 Tax=Fodinibius alkaliphilus TaxID=3140241 RepID=UPI00315AD759
MRFLQRVDVYKFIVALIGLLFFQQATAWAHVKWFSNFSFSDKPLTLDQAVDATFISLLVLSMIVISLLVYFDRQLKETVWFRKVDEWLSAQSEHSLTIIRVTAGAVLLLSWQADAMLVPELNISSAWIGWFQFLLALLLLFRKTVPLAGLGLIVLYGIGIYEFGIFHMLDYPMYAGAGYYLIVANSADKGIRGTGLPALYLTVGFSLCWVALEKIIYPQWGLYVLQQNPQLTMGFDLGFFLIGAAFVEFALGYLLIICLLQRPLALVITLVFFTTTMVFGKLEVIGHTLIHGALIVFLLEGPGKIYKAPITFHKRLGLRMAFGAVNFLVILAILISAYTYSAWHQYDEFSADQGMHSGQVMIADSSQVPAIDIHVEKDSLSGWNLRLDTQAFSFAPEKFGTAHVPGEGHAHLYVDGEKRARIYSRWYHISDLSRGSHSLRVTLNANSHDKYVHGGRVIADTAEIRVE